MAETLSSDTNTAQEDVSVSSSGKIPDSEEKTANDAESVSNPMDADQDNQESKLDATSVVSNASDASKAPTDTSSVTNVSETSETSNNVSDSAVNTGDEKKEDVQVDAKPDLLRDLKFSHVNEQGCKVYNVTESGSVTKTVIMTDPNAPYSHILGRVWINIKGESADGVVFEDHLFEEVDFVLGQAGHCRGVEMALSAMRVGEHAIVTISDPEFAYADSKRPSKCPKDGSNGGFPLKFTVILVDSAPKQKMSHEMTFLEQFELASTLREKGNIRYKKKRYQTAVKLYNKSIQCLEAMKDAEIEALKMEPSLAHVGENEVKQAKISAYSNIAICHLLGRQWGLGVEAATNALKLDSKCVKALIRRGICYKEQGKFEDAQKDIETYLELVENNEHDRKFGKKQLKLLKKARKEADAKIKEQFGGFLKEKKFELYDDKSNVADGGDSGADGNENESWVRMITAPITSVLGTVYDVVLSCCGKRKKKEE